jgi:hypothetical protein
MPQRSRVAREGSPRSTEGASPPPFGPPLGIYKRTVPTPPARTPANCWSRQREGKRSSVPERSRIVLSAGRLAEPSERSSPLVASRTSSAPSPSKSRAPSVPVCTSGRRGRRRLPARSRSWRERAPGGPSSVDSSEGFHLSVSSSVSSFGAARRRRTISSFPSALRGSSTPVRRPGSTARTTSAAPLRAAVTPTGGGGGGTAGFFAPEKRINRRRALNVLFMTPPG